jgi:RNA polymerase sigma factor, sigma-70 family
MLKANRDIEASSDSRLPYSYDALQLRYLMVRYQDGDPAAIEQLIALLSPALYRFLSGPNQNRSDTEDLLQECWARVHRARQSYRPAQPVLPWIFAIANHTRIDGYRRRDRIRRHEVTMWELPENLNRTAELEVQSDGRLEPLLELLPEAQREVVLMLKYSDMTLEDVARATSSTVGAVKQKAHRAYNALRKFLAGDGIHGTVRDHMQSR